MKKWNEKLLVCLLIHFFLLLLLLLVTYLRFIATFERLHNICFVICGWECFHKNTLEFRNQSKTYTKDIFTKITFVSLCVLEIMSKMRTELLKERSLTQQLKQHIEMVDQHLQQWQGNNNNNDTSNTDNAELVREKLQKMASRSISRRSIDLSKDNLMKSLGWFTPANSK